MAGGGVPALGHEPWGGHSWGDHTGGGAADRGRSCRQRAGYSSTPAAFLPSEGLRPLSATSHPPNSLGESLPIPGPCFLPPALSQLLPLCFSLAGPRRKVDVRCVHTPWAAGRVGALHWWGGLPLACASYGLWLPWLRFPSFCPHPQQFDQIPTLIPGCEWGGSSHHPCHSPSTSC